MCLWWLGGETALAEAGPADPPDAAVLAADDERSESDGDTSGGPPPPAPPADVPGVVGDVHDSGAEEGPAGADGPAVAPRAIRSVMPETVTAPSPVQPMEPLSPETPGSESIPVEVAPTVPSSEPEVHAAPVAAPVERMPAPTPAAVNPAYPHPTVDLGDGASLQVPAPPTRPGPADVDEADSASLQPASDGVDPVQEVIGARRDPVAPVSGPPVLVPAGYPAVVGRSAPVSGARQFGAQPGFAEAGLDGIAGGGVPIPESTGPSGMFATTVTLPGGPAPSDSPLARFADYLIHGGPAASGAVLSLLAVVAPGRTGPAAPAADGESVAGAPAGVPRPAHAHPLRRPG